MTQKFNVEEFERTGMEMDAKLANKAEMNAHRSNRSATASCRRTGLDRRWIPSENHYPERRRGGDRRSLLQRSFSDPLESDAPEKTDYTIDGFDAVPEALESEPPTAAPDKN